MNTRVRDYLINRARMRTEQTVNYQRLSDDCHLKLDMTRQQDRNALATILDEISRFEHSNGRTLLSSLVIRKDNGQEGDGFYKMAEKLGFGDWHRLKREEIFEVQQIGECIRSNNDHYQQYR